MSRRRGRQIQMTKRTIALSFALTLWAAAAPAVARHSFGVAFDGNKTVTLTGTITKIEWTNPHTHVYADVKSLDADRYRDLLKRPSLFIRTPPK